MTGKALKKRVKRGTRYLSAKLKRKNKICLE
jgi:hypothetical protein